MSGFVCPHCDEEVDIFGSGGGESLAEEMELPLLGKVPLDAAIRAAGDEGTPTVLSAPESRAGMALNAIANTVADALTPVPTG
jgi:ATP-binding protein involved in chromosome partitioning